jgi:hypothetical protein
MEDTSKPASPSDHVWYHSEGDEKPMGSTRPCSPNKSGEGGGLAGQEAESGSGMFSVAYYVSETPSSINLLLIGVGRIQRCGRGRKMAEALEHEKVDEHGKPIKRLTAVSVGSRKSRQAKKQRIDTTDLAFSDEDDRDYQDTELVESESTSPSESNCQDTLPSNAEASFLQLSW